MHRRDATRVLVADYLTLEQCIHDRDDPAVHAADGSASTSRSARTRRLDDANAYELTDSIVARNATRCAHGRRLRRPERAMSKRLRQEDGIALVMALGITVVLIIFVASMISYTSSNSRAARLSAGDLMALQYADAGLNTAYSIIVNQNVTPAATRARRTCSAATAPAARTTRPARRTARPRRRRSSASPRAAARRATPAAPRSTATTAARTRGPTTASPFRRPPGSSSRPATRATRRAR